MGLTAQKNETLHNEDKSIEVLKRLISAGLKDMEGTYSIFGRSLHGD